MCHLADYGRSASDFLGGRPLGISFAFFFSSNIKILAMAMIIIIGGKKVTEKLTVLGLLTSSLTSYSETQDSGWSLENT